MAFHPYLYFGGNCAEAFTRYQGIFGGELTMLTGDALLMASDSYDDGFDGMRGMCVHWVSNDVAEAQRVFGELMVGGDITAEGEEFWTPFYASGTDRFGTPWQISVETPDHA